jgi:hypothetical protein
MLKSMILQDAVQRKSVRQKECFGSGFTETRSSLLLNPDPIRMQPKVFFFDKDNFFYQKTSYMSALTPPKNTQASLQPNKEWNGIASFSFHWKQFWRA